MKSGPQLLNSVAVHNGPPKYALTLTTSFGDTFVGWVSSIVLSTPYNRRYVTINTRWFVLVKTYLDEDQLEKGLPGLTLTEVPEFWYFLVNNRWTLPRKPEHIPKTLGQSSTDNLAHYLLARNPTSAIELTHIPKQVESEKWNLLLGHRAEVLINSILDAPKRITVSRKHV